MSAEVQGRRPEYLVIQPETQLDPNRLKGPRLDENGCHFGVTVGQNADRVILNIHDHNNPEQIVSRHELIDTNQNLDTVQTRKHYQTFIEGVREGTLYSYQVSGRNVFDKAQPNRSVPPVDVYDDSQLLIDPWGKNVYRHKGRGYSVVSDDRFDWGEAEKPDANKDKIIYEVHVKGATKLLEAVPESLRGTYAGFADEAHIAHLKELGVTHVELLPVHSFTPQNDVKGKQTANYWGYNPDTFFAPNPEYSSDKSPTGPTREFKQMVKKLHQAGIGVILDVVYNHTGEGGLTGLAKSFKGFDNDGYYMYDSHYNPLDHNGCGTNFDASTEAGMEMVIDSLKYWAEEVQVDGFRFDLAPVMARRRVLSGDIDRNNISNTPVLKRINTDPILSSTIKIAEPWDMGGFIDNDKPDRMFFPEMVGWQEWNGRARGEYRDLMRGIGDLSILATLLTGRNSPYGTLNFLTAHDGFTAYDLVSYNHKHNEANGEGNEDGSDDNRSYNHGVEGLTEDPRIIQARLRALRNGQAILSASNGDMMIAAGDEMLKTQYGNNNAYCQDNRLSWLPHDDLSLARKAHFDFVSGDLRFRRLQPQFAKDAAPKRRFKDESIFYKGDHEWLSEHGEIMEQGYEWRDNRVLGLFRSGKPFGRGVDDVLTIHNISHNQHEFILPRNKRFAGLYSIVVDSMTGKSYKNPRDEIIVKGGKLVIGALSTIKLRRRVN